MSNAIEQVTLMVCLLALLLRIRDVPGSYLGSDTVSSDNNFLV
jgi:hypothetical protein